MSEQNKPQNQRRDFLKASGVAALAAIVGAKIIASPSTARAADLPLVKSDDPMAKALGYSSDAKKVDLKKWPKRAGAEGAKEFCYNCQFYQEKKDPKASKQGPCQLFAGKAVESHGWCNSWTQNPAVKG